jgi:hypothetical protein
LRKTPFVCAIALALSARAHASFAVPPNAPGQYAPRDECSAKPGGAEFLAKLQSAVKARDAKAFADLTSSEIMLDFGGGGGREAVLDMLKPGSKKWRELDRLMVLGCAWDEDNAALVMPWFFNQDMGDTDPFSTNVTLGSAVPMRERPMRSANVRKVLNWQLIHIYEVEVPDPGWAQIAVIDSDWEGYIRLKDLRSPLDYRLRAEKQGGEWRITSFVAGE